MVRPVRSHAGAVDRPSTNDCMADDHVPCLVMASEYGIRLPAGQSPRGGRDEKRRKSHLGFLANHEANPSFGAVYEGRVR